MKLADTWSWVCGRAKSSSYNRHELQETRQRGAYPFRFGKNINRIQDDTQKPSGLLAELRKFKSSSKQNFGKQVKIKVIKNEATNFIQ